MASFAILTNVGRNKEAADLANSTPLEIADIAWGDGKRIPAGGEIALENEQGRKAVQAKGTVADALNTAFFEVLLAEDEGPFVIREAGIFDVDGDMIAIAHYDPPVNKPLNTVSAHLRIKVVFTDLENLVIKIDASTAFVSAERKLNTGPGLKGGGDLSADRTLAVDFATQAEALAGLKADKVISPKTLNDRVGSIGRVALPVPNSDLNSVSLTSVLMIGPADTGSPASAHWGTLSHTEGSDGRAWQTALMSDGRSYTRHRTDNTPTWTSWEQVGTGAAQHSGSGFQMLQGGLILQWGSFVFQNSSNGLTVTVPLPMAFPNNHFQTILGDTLGITDTNPGHSEGAHVTTQTLANFVVHSGWGAGVKMDATRPARFFSIGN